MVRIADMTSQPLPKKICFYTYIYENKGAASLFSLHRQYHPSASYIRNFKPLTIFCGCTSRLMFDLVRNHRDRVSCDVAQISKDQLCLVMRKPFICTCENKDADQLRGNREADQCICFRDTDCSIPLLPNSEISSL